MSLTAAVLGAAAAYRRDAYDDIDLLLGVEATEVSLVEVLDVALQTFSDTVDSIAEMFGCAADDLLAAERTDGPVAALVRALIADRAGEIEVRDAELATAAEAPDVLAAAAGLVEFGLRWQAEMRGVDVDEWIRRNCMAAVSAAI